MSRVFRAVPIALSLGVIVAAGAAAVPAATGPAAEPLTAELPRVPTRLVCPPPPKVSNQAVGVDAGFAAQPVQPVTALSALTYRQSGAPAALTGLTLPDSGPGSGPDSGSEGEAKKLPVTTGAVNLISQAEPQAVSLDAAPGATGQSALGALASTLTTEGDLAGLAISSCSAPSASGWLLGGGLAVGRTSRVVLSNPGRTAASVNLTVLTVSGSKSPAAGQEIVVPAGHTREVLLPALVDGNGPTAIGFKATGGTVAANLVDAELAGITPRGVEHVQVSAPATRSAITPLDRAAGKTVLRLANPGSAPTDVHWQGADADGQVEVDGKNSTTVQAGTVVELPVDLGEATALVVDSEAPVLASAIVTKDRTSPGTTAAADFAVLPAAPALSAENLVTAVPGKGMIGLVAGDKPTTLVVRSVDAKGAATAPEQTIALQPGTARTLPIPDGALAVQLSVRSGQLFGGQFVTAGSGFVAGTAIAAPLESQRTVSVRVAP